VNQPGGFNLIDDPWISVLDDGGDTHEVSILGLLEQAPRLARIVGDVETQAFAITRLLLAFVHRALDGPQDEEDWHELWEADELPLERIRRYADRVRHRFELFDPDAPFFQVAGLQAQSNEVSGLEKIIADIPNGTPFFTTRSAVAIGRISPAEAARWLVHVHAFDPAGIKTGVVGDPTAKGGRGYGSSVGWSGQVGGVVPNGANLRETLVLNLIARSAAAYLQIGGDTDLPPWERDPDGPAWSDRPARGAIDVYTWQTRRVRLVGDRDGVTGVVLAKGDVIESRNLHGVDPHSAWRYSEPQSKRHKTVVYMPFTHDPNRSVWRGLSAFLPATASRRTSGREPQPFLAPGVLQWIADLAEQGYLPDGYQPRTRIYGVQYGTQNAVYGDIFTDELPLSVKVLRDDHPEAGRVAVAAIEDAEAAASELYKLAENVAQAGGAEPNTGAGDTAREQLYAALDSPYRGFLARLLPDADLQLARTDWSRRVYSSARTIAHRIVTNAPPAAWKGREIRGRLINVGLAETWFIAALRRQLPPQVFQMDQAEEIPA
jgi:CRISPR system Cascade subunit CasA